LAVEQASILRCRQPIKEFGFACSLQQIESFIAKGWQPNDSGMPRCRRPTKKDNEIFLAMLRQEAAKQGVAA
jgi:hypothetical protein